MHWPTLVAGAPEMVRNSDEMLKYITNIKSEVTSNQVTLEAMETTVYIYRTSAKKILAIDRVMKLYRQAQTLRKSNKKKASGLIQIAINTLLPLKNDYALVVKGLEQARDQRGASPNDVKDAIAVSGSIDNMVNRLKSYKELPIPKPESIGL